MHLRPFFLKKRKVSPNVNILIFLNTITVLLSSVSCPQGVFPFSPSRGLCMWSPYGYGVHVTATPRSFLQLTNITTWRLSVAHAPVMCDVKKIRWLHPDVIHNSNTHSNTFPLERFTFHRWWADSEVWILKTPHWGGEKHLFAQEKQNNLLKKKKDKTFIVHKSEERQPRWRERLFVLLWCFNLSVCKCVYTTSLVSFSIQLRIAQKRLIRNEYFTCITWLHGEIWDLQVGLEALSDGGCSKNSPNREGGKKKGDKSLLLPWNAVLLTSIIYLVCLCVVVLVNNSMYFSVCLWKTQTGWAGAGGVGGGGSEWRESILLFVIQETLYVNTFIIL